ncbi:hypothetical protein FACS1894147_05790 [Spirochaetia bacterium]|nr:hypothetical protein FACS1894147_05790 [Spirochaetia bacterium]
MGEKLYVASEFQYRDIHLAVELNAGSAAAKYPLHVHVQNEQFRFDVTESDFMQMAAAICAAKKRLIENKHLQHEKNEDDV